MRRLAEVDRAHVRIGPDLARLPLAKTALLNSTVIC
jgi:hypothetical protein